VNRNPIETEPKPDRNRTRIEPTLQTNTIQRLKIEPKPDQKRTKSGSKVEKLPQVPANAPSTKRKRSKTGFLADFGGIGV
jgi:hypothetical protein